MAYNEQLAQKVMRLIKSDNKVSEVKMFGGISFLVGGNMAVGVYKNELILRVDPEKHAEFAAKPHVRDFDLMKGKPPKGWLMLGEKGTESDKELKAWVQTCVAYASGLPKKAKGKKKSS